MSQISHFSENTIRNLKNYVYILYDSVNSQIFYVGRGTDDRCFDHIAEARNTRTRNPKLDRIRSVGEKNIDVYLIHWGMTAHQAEKVEASIIDLLSAFNFRGVDLSNQRHEDTEHGFVSVERIEDEFGD